MHWRSTRCRVNPDHVLIDGRPVPLIGVPQTAIIEGDAKSFSIAAASVIAKVTRDRMMMQMHEQFPAVQFRAAQRIRHARTSGRARTIRPVARAPEVIRARASGRRACSSGVYRLPRHR